MKMHCLILSDRKDPHVARVLEHLPKYAPCDHIWIDTADSLRDFKVGIALDPVNKVWRGSINEIDVSALNSIWYRRPSVPRSDCMSVNPRFAKLAEEEMREVLHNFYRIAGCRI